MEWSNRVTMAGMELPAFDTLWNYGDPAGTEAKFRAILAEHEATAPVAYVAELLTQVARCQGLRGDFAAGHETLDRVERMLTADLKRARVRFLLERGRVFNSSGPPSGPQEALPLFEEAWAVGQAAGEMRLAFDALHMVALAQPTAAERVAWNLKGIAAVAAEPSQKGWLPAFYNNLGEAYAALEEWEKALQAFRDLDAVDRAAGREPDMFTQKDIAKMLRKLGRVAEAIAIIAPIHADLERQQKPDGWIDEEMAECLLATGRAAESRPLFKRALAALREDAWVKQHDPAKLVRLAEEAAK